MTCIASLKKQFYVVFSELYFSGTIRARVMKHGQYLHLIEGSLMYPSKLAHDLYFVFHLLKLMSSFSFQAPLLRNVKD